MAKFNLSNFIVRKRLWFLVAAVALAVACVFMIPRTNINSDMTRYLPDGSQMKQGIDQMSEDFGDDGLGSGMVRVMFTSLSDSLKTATKDELSAVDGVSNILYQDGSEEYNREGKVLYELLCGSQRSQYEIANEISEKYGDKVVVETSEKDTAAPIGVMLIAFALLLAVLIIMCESWLEPPIFLAAIGVAIAINMGTNALLESVSATTNSIASILQLVLSIDYSIILMNRYRQEKMLEKSDKVTAMTNALKKASSSIVSSAFTTIVGLMALVFMKLKIGADMGIVLAKGVLCSLVAIFTVLPAVILALDSAIAKSTKKVLKFRTDRLAGFSMKFRIPLAIVFVAIFAVSYYFHRKTEISFSPEQKSEIAKYFPPKNIMVLLYENSDSTRIIELSDSLSANKNVKSFISYPSLMQKQHTAAETKSMVGDFSAMAGDGDYNVADYDINTIVDAIYYISTKDPSEEKMTLHEFATLAAKFSSDSTFSSHFGNQSDSIENGLQYLDILVSLTDTALIDSLLTSDEISDIIGVDKEMVAIICPANQKTTIREIVKSSKELLTGSMIPANEIAVAHKSQHVEQQAETPVENDSVTTPDNVVNAETESISDDNESCFTDSTVFMSQHSTSEIAKYMGMKEKSASIIFNLYGRSKGQKTKTMSLYDFIHFINSDLVNRKIFASQIDDVSRKWLLSKENIMNEVLRSGREESVVEEIVVGDEDVVAETKFETITVHEEPDFTFAMAKVDNENIDKLNMAEKIMKIATEGRSFNADGMYALLDSLGAETEKSDIELAFLYNGITNFDDETVKMSAEEIIGTLNDSVIANPRYATMLNDEMKAAVDDINAMIDENIGGMRGRNFSQAIIFTDLPKESDETSNFVEMLASQCETKLSGSHYLIGESVMMNEMRNQFGGEMLLVTLITILSIFLIVAITFRSLAVPAILVMTVMSAVYINVIVSGLNGTLLYLAYLIMQSILMGATIDYGILFTNNYREARVSMSRINSIRKAYMSSTHTIFTSGMIMTLAPLAMSLMLDDPTTIMILQCIAAGAFAAVLLIIFVLPGLLAAFDRFVVRKGFAFVEERGDDKTSNL
ncbi:MAG: MMPL family transporter [Bacteroidales bacterium]|nr:MMPL family transporter [Bacteroidales bacterium]